jgi:sensor c-di-GMP phosphodiesterase-like protein
MGNIAERDVVERDVVEMMSKVLLMLVSALLSSLLTFVFAVQGDRNKLVTQLETLSTQMEERTDDRYRGSDARRDFDKVSVQIANNAEHIKELQALVRNHAQDRGLHQ